MNTDDHDLLNRLRQGEKEAFELIYRKYYNEFMGWSTKNYRCSKDEAREVFQSAVIVLYENLTNGIVTTLQSSVKTYLYGIGKNKLREQIRESSRISGDLSIVTEVPDEIPEEDVPYPEQMVRVRQSLTELGEPCQELLELYYYQHRTMEEIADKLKYSNANSAKNQKYKCLVRLRKIYREKTNQYARV